MLTLERLKRLLSYDHETGVFRYLENRGKCRKGAVAGWPGGGDDPERPYWKITIDGRKYYAHVLAWFFVYGEWPPRLDHEDRNKQNNAILNLRISTCAQNMMNSTRDSTSGLRGVRQRTKNSFNARITLDGREISLGHFRTAEKAHRAYVKAAVEHFGEFADVHLLAIGTTNEEARG
jgi:hypothetical protein